jgi:hypothetical protein
MRGDARPSAVTEQPASRVTLAAVYCSACGRQLPDDARFCLECGAPQSSHSATPVGQGDHWETCRIGYSDRFLSPRFHATVTTQTGSYSVLDPWGRTIMLRDKLPFGRDRTTVRSHSALVERLVREGWEPIGSGEWWWQRDFRRLATAREWEYCEIILNGGRWVASAIDDRRQFVAAQSEHLKGFTRRKQIANGRGAFQDLINSLGRDGWEFDRLYGHEEWEQRWRRRLNRTSDLDRGPSATS